MKSFNRDGRCDREGKRPTSITNWWTYYVENSLKTMLDSVQWWWIDKNDLRIDKTDLT